ncbi:hypothetical protein [Leucobacter tenebrionis]|uniref:hypothetical protein n=1 Tax=Leucobacter tenebrionis TaxID=2873270 RepID=UPI001CA6128A|nr:hypothetical protein [Leucobacter tenebrionis]QZY51352.1 hypothetical protein KVY00_12310 [Leucobacter tenebrionis]
MFTAAPTPSAESGDPFALILALAALLVSLLAVLVPAATGRQQRKRDDRAKRSEMYLELMELIEGHGLWVMDRTHDLLESGYYLVDTPLRGTSKPDRAQRVRARAIVSAYGSSRVSEAFSEWQGSLESFEAKLDEFAYIVQETHPDAVDTDEAKPLCEAEAAARRRVADTVNTELVNDRRWRRHSIQ